MCVCVCVCDMQWEWFSYVELMLALKPFLEECSCTCLKDNDLARRCLWPNISHPSSAVGSFLYTSLLTAHVTTVLQNVLWEMLNYSHYKERDAKEYSGRCKGLLVRQSKLTSCISFFSPNMPTEEYKRYILQSSRRQQWAKDCNILLGNEEAHRNGKALGKQRELKPKT